MHTTIFVPSFVPFVLDSFGAVCEMISSSPYSDRYRDLPVPKEDVVFALNSRAKKDKDQRKVNLVIGAYRDAHGKPMVLRSVRKAEQDLVNQEPPLDKEYQDIDGHKGFLKESVKLLLGRFLSTPDRLARVAAVQTLSGTGAIRIAGELMRQTLPLTTPVYISDPTWPNHPTIFQECGFTRIIKYRYFDRRTNLCDFDGMYADLADAPKEAIVVFHLCAHNPTGADPSPLQWEELANLCLKKHFNIIFDSAYQGYASGSLQRDAYAARLFAEKGIEFSTAQSYSKNMGLYGERIGCFSVLCGSEKSAQLLTGLLKNIIRPMYSNPPLHGARLAHSIMSDPERRADWESELKSMAERIQYMRKTVYLELLRLKTPGKWDHIVKQIGMFSYLGLSVAQCQRLQSDYHIYLMNTGRVNIAGLTKDTAIYLARCIHAVVQAPVKGAAKL